MDTFLAIASRREVRDYDERPLPPEVEERILDAGRLAGNSKNRQPWRFVIAPRDLLAEYVYNPENLRGAALVVAIVVQGKGPISFDAGRAAQNMLLAAWNEGVGGSPNGIEDAEGAGRALGPGRRCQDCNRAELRLPPQTPRPREPQRRRMERPREAAAARRARRPQMKEMP